MVAVIEMMNDTSPETSHIAPKTCFDLSGHCAQWKQQGHCGRNQYFMKEYCSLTCRYCSEKSDQVQMMEIKKGKQKRKEHQRKGTTWKDEF